MVRKNFSVEESKQALKKEIIRLGIQDNPSRTVYQKKYNRELAPSPNATMKATGMKWQELMNDLGFKYDGRKNITVALEKSNKDKKRNRRGAAINFDDPLVRKEIIDRAVVAINYYGYTTPQEAEKNFKSVIDVGYEVLVKNGITWEVLTKAYKEKYSKPLLKTGEYEKNNWNQFSNKELLEHVAGYVKKNNVSSIYAYEKKHTGDYNAPSVEYLINRTGYDRAELWRTIQLFLS